jgi:hypothetical protein
MLCRPDPSLSRREGAKALNTELRRGRPPAFSWGFEVAGGSRAEGSPGSTI